MFEYMTAQEAAEKWDVSIRWVQRLCKQKRIDGALNVNRVWLIPIGTKKPMDARFKAPNVQDWRKIMKKILIVEDSTEINNMICDYLSKKLFECTQAFSGTEALLYLKNQNFDIIILDLMLPGINGNELISKIRPDIKTPVIILSARDELDTKVNSLMSGADDYITKPFELEELYARISVQLRKASPQFEFDDVIQYKELKISKQKHTVSVKEHELNFTRQEFKILELLLSKKDKVFSKQEIYDYAWDNYYMGEDKTVNVHISHIRSKIKQYTEEEYIETVWGIGFKIAD